MMFRFAVLSCVALVFGGNPIRKKTPPPSLIDQMIHEAEQSGRTPVVARPSPGSLYSPGAQFANFTREFRAGAVDDLVTVVVSDKASAVTNGTTNTSRKSSA